MNLKVLNYVIKPSVFKTYASFYAYSVKLFIYYNLNEKKLESLSLVYIKTKCI